MKVIQPFLFVGLLIAATTANAQFIQAEVRNITISSTAGNVVVQLVDLISNNDCPNPDTDSIRNLILRQGDARFEELYARFLIAEANNEIVEVLATAGQCASNGTGLSAGIYRFGRLN